MSGGFDPYHVWLGIPPDEQPPNHYRLLGLRPFEDLNEVIENAADKQTVHLRTFQLSKHRDVAEKLLNEIATAKICLLDRERKAAYDEKLRQQLAAAKSPPAEDVLPAEPAEDGRLGEESAVPAFLGKKMVLAAAGLGLVGTLGIVLWAWAIFVRHPDGKQPALTANVPEGSQVAVGAKGSVDVAHSEGGGSKPARPAVPPPDTAKSTPPKPESAQVVVQNKPARPANYSNEQRDCAEQLGLPVELTNSLGMPLVLIPPGQFEMGSTPEEIAAEQEQAEKYKTSKGSKGSHNKSVLSESPRHRVRITRPFYVGMYPVTQGQYEKLLGVNPSAFTEKQMDASTFQPPMSRTAIKYRVDDRARVAGKDTRRHPVETVTWQEALEFCRRLSELPTERAARRVYRLPSEAEWEYACRAGTTTRWYSGDDEAGLAAVAWFNEYSHGGTHPVGEKKPNAWGLFDMHGNVSQWCADWYRADYYQHSPASDPGGPSGGSGHVVRGGNWSNGATLCRSACRASSGSVVRYHNIGFRVAAGR